MVLHASKLDRIWYRPAARPICLLLAGLFLAALLAATSAAEHVAGAQSISYYVSPSGNDANSCASSASPCRTIQAAIDKASVGATVRVAAGTYSENIEMKSGVDVIGASPSTTAIVGNASTSGVVAFPGVKNATFQGFRITVDAPISGYDRGVNFTGSTDRTAVLRNTIIHGVQYGIFVWAPASPTIENNTLAGGPDEQGIYVGNSATSPLIRNNIISGFFFAGIHVVGGNVSPAPAIEYNDLWDNGEHYRNFPDQTGVNGNISSDPLFVDTATRNFHVRNAPTLSPAIDAGNPASNYANEPAPNGSRINMGAYGNTPEAATTPGNANLVDFETPALGSDLQRLISPYTDAATGIAFAPAAGSSGAAVVGLVKNSATSACVEPSDANQKLGSGVDAGSIGKSGFAIKAVFPTALAPPVSVSVQFQTGAGDPIRLRLFDSADREVASLTEQAGPANGTCGYPGDARARMTLSVNASQPVAYAIMDMEDMTGGIVFVIDDFRFSSGYGAHSIRNVALAPSSPANLKFDDKVNLTFDYATTEAGGVYIWARPMTNGSPTPNYSAHPSPLYPAGSGSGAGDFTITDNDAVVDQVRLQMWTIGQTQLLTEIFVPVNYHFSSGMVCHTLNLAHGGSGGNPTASPVKSAACASPGQYVQGQLISLSASPASGWQVNAWSGTDDDSSQATNNTLTMPAHNHTVAVNYAQNSNPEMRPDDYEVDNTCAMARSIVVDGGLQDHTFHVNGDTDWLRFDIAADASYRIEVQTPTGSPADVILMLYPDCDAAPTEQWDKAFTPGVRLDFEAAAAGAVFLRLANVDPNVAGAHVAYHVSVRHLQTTTGAKGALIILAGRLKTPDPLQANIHHITDLVYNLYRARGYGDENIHYLALDPALPGNDRPATTANLEEAITVWAADKVNADQPLTLFLMDHGGDDKLFVDEVNGQQLNPADLDRWLGELEAMVPNLEVTVIVEACYSGSFIDGVQSISKPNRTVITSTSAQAVAYASADGAQFSDRFVSGLSEGYGICMSFRNAQDAVQQLHALQDPWIDANGNRVPNEQADCEGASQRRSNTDNAPADSFAPYVVWANAPDEIIDNRGIIRAQVRDNKAIARVWAVIYAPSHRTVADGLELVAEDAPMLDLVHQGGGEYSVNYAGFGEPGRYRIAFYAEDDDGLKAQPHIIEVMSGQQIFVPIMLH